MALRTWLAALAVCVCAIAAANAATLTREDVMRVRVSPAVLTTLERLEQHTDDTADYSAALAAIAETEALTAAQREAALFAGTLRLAALPPTDEARSLVTRLATRSIQIEAHAEDGHGRHATPVFDVAAAARFVGRQWRVREISERARVVLTQRTPLTMRAFAAEQPDVIAAGLELAMRKASFDELLAQRAPMLEALPREPHMGQAALAAGRRLGDAGLLAAVAAHATERQARGAIASARDLDDQGAALTVLRAGLAREAIASTAVFALVELYASSPAAADMLAQLLEDRRLGGSAAAALAKLDDPAVANRLADRLAGEPRATIAARLALALALMQNDTAARRLREFIATPGTHTALKTSLAERVR